MRSRYRVRPGRVFVVRRRWAAVLLVAALAALAWGLAAGQTGAGRGGVAARGQAPAPGPSAAPSSAATPPAATAPWPIPGYLLIADRGNDRILLVDSRRRILWRYPGRGAHPSIPFASDDAFFAPGYDAIVTNQEFLQTLQMVSFPGGRVLWRYGHPYRAGSAPGHLNTPDDAYALANGTVSVADIKNCRVLFIRGHRVVRRLGTPGNCVHDPPRSFGSPNGDTPMPNGATLVTEINGSWVDAISASGRLLWSVHAPVVYPSDAQWLGNDRILLADFTSPGAIVIMRPSGKVLWRYGPTSGPGMLDHPSLAIMLPNGLIAVNDDFHDRVVIIDPARHRIVWQYGRTGVPGSSPGHLNTPDGMDFLPYALAMASPAIRAVVAGG